MCREAPLLVPDLSAPGTGIPEAPTARGSPDRMLSKCRKKGYELINAEKKDMN